MSAIGRDEKFRRALVTPEGVDLRLMLGDAGDRATAFFLDVIFIGLALAAMTLVIFLVGLATHLATFGFIAAIWLLVFFVLRNFYFLAFELTPRAATPGKRIVGLRVTTRDGSPLTGSAIFARNAMRELEIFLPLSFMGARGSDVDGWISLLGLVWCGVFAFFPLFNRDRLRVGDLVAGTWVVRAPKKILDVDLAGGEAARIEFSPEALDAYGIKELTILEDVLRRRDALILHDVATRIRAKIKFDTPMPDEEFLMAYYAALRGRLETRLLFGRRRRDKHEKP
jgi:uncharacterized RDD family membrane protein YckC